MFVILAYDVNEKRVRKVRKTVLRYLHPVQRSVFEGWLTEGKLNALKRELKGLMDPAADSAVLYEQTFTGLKKESIGRQKPEAHSFL